MIDLLTPPPDAPPQPRTVDGARYVRSYLYMRLFVGALGVALPFALVLLDGLAFDGPFPRDSMSAYYYSGAREVFVGAMCAIGVFLITYKVAEKNLDNTLSILAGAMALLVALFPTGRPDGGDEELTPLQDLLSEKAVMYIHYGSAILFIASLAVICFFFGVREGRRDPRPGNRSPAFWRRYHWACAGTIVAAGLWILATAVLGGPSTALFWGEAVSVFAFGASWFMKGYERDVLGRDAAPSSLPV